MEKFERHTGSHVFTMLSGKTAFRFQFGSAIASTQLFIREYLEYVACQTSYAPRVCMQSVSALDRRERQSIDTGVKARVRFPVRDETRNYNSN